MSYVDDKNYPPQHILDDAKQFFKDWFAPTDGEQADWINAEFGWWWGWGSQASALVQVYDLVAPLDATAAGRYLHRLRIFAGVFLDNRDDKRRPPLNADEFRNRVMAAWGRKEKDRDNKWNTDPGIAGLFTYAMAAFARRVADHPAHYPQHQDYAVRFITATIESYMAFRPELHLCEGDPHAYFKVPAAYAGLQCGGNESCQGYRATAGQEISYNENLSMMKALAEVALAADSALYRGSADATPEFLQLATEEAPLLIAKNVAFFADNLQPKTLPDGTPYFEWKHQRPTWNQQPEDTDHGGMDIDCLSVILDDQIRLNALLARAGRNERIPLSPSLFARFANTFLCNLWHDNMLNADVVGGEPHDSDKGCGGWIPLAQFEPRVWTRARDTVFHDPTHKLNAGSHGALLRYRQFNSMKYLTEFAGQNWLITPAALAVGESPPANIHEQKWLLVLSGVVIADLKGDNTGQWNHQTVSFMPDMAGPDDPSSTSGPLNWAINRYSIPKPPGAPGAQFLIRFSVEEWAPFVSPNAIFNQGQSINSGFAVDAWRPNHFGNGLNLFTHQHVNNLFTGINADLAVRDTDAWLYRLGYNITLLGKIVFVAVSLEKIVRP